MKINRYGSTAYHGTSSISLHKPSITWNAKTQRIIISKERANDFSTTSTHDYQIEVELDEVNLILQALATDGLKKSFESVAEGLAPALRSMLIITNAQTRPDRYADQKDSAAE